MAAVPIPISEGFGIEIFPEEHRDDARVRKRQKDAEAREAKKLRKEENETKNFVEQVFGWWIHWRGKWTNVSDQRVSRLSQVEEQATLMLPLSLCEYRRYPESLLLHLVDYLLPVTLFEEMKQPTNAAAPQNEMGGQCRTPFTANEIIRAVYAQIEHRGPRHEKAGDYYFKAKDQQQQLRASIGKARRWGLGFNRFMEICAYLTPDLDAIPELLSRRSRDFVKIKGSWAIDESLIACKSDKAPTVWIERKPHPVGLRNFLTCLKFPFTDRTYCVLLQPDYGFDKKLTVRQVLEVSFAVAKCLDHGIAMTADAWFSLKDFLEPNHEFQQNKFIISFNKARAKDFWRVMMSFVSPGQYKMALHSSGNLLASFYLDKGEMAVLTNCILSDRGINAQIAPAAEETTLSEVVDESTVEEEAVLPEQVPGMCVLCHQMGTSNPHQRGFLTICAMCESTFHRRNCASRPGHFAGVVFCQRTCKENWMTYVRECLAVPEPADKEPVATLQEQRVPVSDKAAKRMASLPRFVMQEYAKANGLDALQTNREIAYRLGGFDGALAEVETSTSTPTVESSNSAPEQPTQQPTEPVAGEPSDLAQSAAFSSSSEVPVWNEQQTRDKLKILAVTTLKARVEKYGLKPRTDKSELVEQVLLAEMPKNLREEVLNQCFAEIKKTSAAGKTKPYVHNSYGERFNSVDTFDKRIYEMWNRKKTANWKFTALLGFIFTAFCNVHAWFEEYRCIQANSPRHYRGTCDAFNPQPCADLLALILHLKRAQLGIAPDPTDISFTRYKM